MKSCNVIAREQGFTLLELMVAMTLVSMLLSMIYASFSVVVRSWDGIDRVSTDNEEMRVFQTFLQQKLSMARPLISHQSENAGLLFSGANNSLSFTATSPAHMQDRDGLYNYTLETRQENSGTILEMYYESIKPDSVVNRQADQGIKLLDNISSVDFSYFGKPQGKGKTGWHSEWSSSFKLPSMVRIRVRRDSKYPAWPDIIISLKAGSST